MAVENMSFPLEQALRTALEFVKQGIAVTDLNGIIIDVNNGLLEIFGYQDKGALIGTELIYLIKAHGKSYASENLKEIYENNSESDYDYIFVRADGSTFTGGLKTRIINDINGKPSGYVTVFSDYSERVKIQEDILIAEQNFRYSLDNSPMGIVIISSDNELLYANNTILNIYGFDRVEELETTPPSMFLTPKSYIEHRERLKNKRLGKSIPYTFDVSIIRKDRGIRHLIAFRQPIIWNREVCNQISYHDITEIKESEELQRALADNSPIGVYIIQNGKFCYANTKFIRLTGFTPEELLRMNPKEFIYPDDMKHVRDNAIRMLKDDVVNSYEFRYINRQGEIRWAIESVSSISYEGKRATIGNFTDITDHKKMVEELSYSDASLRSIHEGVYTMDNDYRITRWNSMCTEMFNIREDDAIGKYIWEILEPVEDYPGHNQDRIDLLFKQGYNKEEQIISYPNGEIWAEVFAQAVEANGERLGWVIIISEISERKRMEKELKESEQYMRSLINSLEDFVITYDLEGHYGSFYKALHDTQEPLENSDAKFVGVHYRDVLPSSVSDKLDIAFKSVINTGENTEFDYSIEFNENDRWYNAKVSPIRDASGEFSEILVVSRDITERKQMESELQASEEQVRSLLNSMDDLVFSFDMNGIFKNFHQPTHKHNHLMKAVEFIGKDHREILPVDFSEKLDSAICALTETGKPQQFDYCIKSVDELLWYNARISPVTDTSGEITGITAVSRNITERKNMEEIINRAAKEWETTFNAMFESIYIVDRDYRVVKANKTHCDNYNVNPVDIVGRHCYEITHGRNNPCL
ncbi:MAG: PAS domain S-box protein, partial [Dehalococcoidales bacterium]